MRTGDKAPRVLLGNSSSRVKMARLKELLAEKAYTSQEICEELGASRSCVYAYVRTLKDEGEIFIERWRKDADNGNQPIPFYRLGNKPDAPKPPLIGTERRIVQREAVEEDPIARDALEAKAAIRNLEQSRKAQGLPPVPPDPLLAWIPRRDMREAA